MKLFEITSNKSLPLSDTEQKIWIKECRDILLTKAVAVLRHKDEKEFGRSHPSYFQCIAARTATLDIRVTKVSLSHIMAAGKALTFIVFSFIVFDTHPQTISKDEVWECGWHANTPMVASMFMLMPYDRKILLDDDKEAAISAAFGDDLDLSMNVQQLDTNLRTSRPDFWPSHNT